MRIAKIHGKMIPKPFKISGVAILTVTMLSGLTQISAAEFPRRNAVVTAIEHVGPAVVNISTERIVRQSVRPRFGPFWSPFDDLFRDRLYRTESLGSGVLIDQEGHLLTNEHVVRQAERIVVALYDGSEYEADLVGTDSRNDIAILKIRPQEGVKAEFAHVPFGHSDDLMIGETVIAIGNPQGFRNTVTVGVISALERRIYVDNRDFPGLIQTDAAINPGNSGGPLVNINGELIGINMAMANAENIGFAVPVSRVQKIYNEFVKGVISLVDTMGITVENIPPRIAKYLGLPSTDGVIITSIIQGGYADQAELQSGDVITEIDGQLVTSLGDYDRYLTEHEVEDRLQLKLIREGKKKGVKIGLRPRLQLDKEQLAKPWFGIVAVGISSDIAKSLRVRVDQGVLVYSVEEGSAAAAAGLRPGDIIQSVGRKAIASIGDYRQARTLLEAYNAVEMLVLRGGRQYKVELKKAL